MSTMFAQSSRPTGGGDQTSITNIISGQGKGMCSLLLIALSLVSTGTYATSSTPRVKQLETYLAHSCALFQTGEVSCWGFGGGSLGDGTLDNRSSPVPVMAINDRNSRLTGVKALAAGGAGGFTCALLKSSHVACWGRNQLGQLGNINTTEVDAEGQPISTTPVLVRDIDGSGYLNGVRQIALGINAACALLQGGRVACWGANFLGFLGSDEDNEMFDSGSFSTRFSSTPLLVKDTSGSGVLKGVKELSSAVLHICGRLRTRQVACWGANFNGALGAPTEELSSTTPLIAHPDDPALRRVKQVSTHAGATCVLSENGTVDCWGGNFFGVLGNGTTINSATPVAVKPIGGGDGRLRGVKRLRSGGSACVELRKNRVACWGGNTFGQLGNGSTDISTVPVEPLGIDGIGKLRNVKTIKPGFGFSTCALQKGNQVLCWGSNGVGELGDGTNDDSLFPVRVTDLR